MLFDLIKNHWEMIITCLFILISLLINIFRKKNVSSLMEVIYSLCIIAINICETSSVVGSLEKLEFAVSLVKTFLEEAYPGIKTSSYDSVIKKTIEDILSTPQKK